MEISKFCRACPTCLKLIYYKTKKILATCSRRNTECKKCANRAEKNPNFGIPCPIHVRQKVKEANLGKIDSMETRRKKSVALSGNNNPMFGLTGSLCPNFGAVRTEDHKKRLHDIKYGVPLSEAHRESISESLRGRTHSLETLRKQRLGKINYIIQKNGSIAPRYNTLACQYFNSMETEKNWNGLYATKNGEFYIKHLGYFVDYYEPVLNIVVEYDEPLHYNVDNSLKKRDVVRMMEIVDYLKCEFFRFNQRTGELKKYA